jgi:hypothetical protein
VPTAFINLSSKGTGIGVSLLSSIQSLKLGGF